MSAFGVVVGRGGDPTREMMTRMGNALRLHGPDRAGQRILDGVGLVSALMLGFTPQHRFERQPAQAAGRFHLVFAGWIANRAEMIDLLQVEPGRAEAMPDSARWRGRRGSGGRPARSIA